MEAAVVVLLLIWVLCDGAAAGGVAMLVLITHGRGNVLVRTFWRRSSVTVRLYIGFVRAGPHFTINALVHLDFVAMCVMTRARFLSAYPHLEQDE